MSDLHPTKTRLALLADVDQPGEPLVYGEAGHAWWRMGTKVTARMDELERAGWVEVHIGRLNRENGVGGRWYFRLTATGQKVLDVAEGLTWGVYDHGCLIEKATTRYLAEMIRHDAADAADRDITDYTIRLVDGHA